MMMQAQQRHLQIQAQGTMLMSEPCGARHTQPRLHYHQRYYHCFLRDLMGRLKMSVALD